MTVSLKFSVKRARDSSTTSRRRAYPLVLMLDAQAAHFFPTPLLFAPKNIGTGVNV